MDEYWSLLESPIAVRSEGFTDKLIASVRHHAPDTAIAFYHRLIERTVLSRKRADYEKARDYLMDLWKLYEGADQENQWDRYLTCFRKQHARKRLLLQIIDAHLTAG